MAYVEETDNGTKRQTREALQKTRDNFKKGKDIEFELTKVWNKVKEDAYDGCPKDTVSLASTIRVVKIPLGQLSSAWSRIKEITMFDRSIVAGDITKINPKTKRPVDYAVFIHDGFTRKNGRFYNGVPFLSNALALNSEEINRAIERALRKLGKRFEKGE